MNVPVKDTWRIAMPTPPKGAKWTEAPKVVTRLNYRSDRVGYTDDAYRHIFVIPADGGTARQITNGDWNHSAPAFSADGKWIAFSSLREPDAENAFRKSQIYAANVETGEIKQLTHRNGTNGSPTFSPDGKTIAFMSADSTDHSAWAESKLYVMNADGSNVHLVSGTLDRPISGVIWAPDNSGVYFNVESEGSKNLYFTTTAGQFHPVTSGKHVLTVASVGKTGLAVGVRSTPTKPNDVVTFTVPKTGATSSFTQLTAVNDDVLAGKELAQTEEIWYTSKDGLKIQGWIVKPPGFDATKKYPLILEIHGGPQSMYNVGFSFARQDHAANGYVMLYTNPRGSTGYGEKFTNEIKNAYPGKDFDDLMAGVDTVIGRGYVDTEEHVRVRLLGRRRADGVDRGPHRPLRGRGGALPGDRLDQLRRRDRRRRAGTRTSRSRSGRIRASTCGARRSCTSGNVKTPTMLMTGVLDLRTPMPQIEEYYRALKMRGVPTAMIRMNNEYHGTSSTPSNFLRTQLYLRAWFDPARGAQRRRRAGHRLRAVAGEGQGAARQAAAVREGGHLGDDGAGDAARAGVRDVHAVAAVFPVPARLALLALLVVCAGAARRVSALGQYPDGVKVVTHVEYYEVFGRTSAELAADLQRRGPRDDVGRVRTGDGAVTAAVDVHHGGARPRLHRHRSGGDRVYTHHAACSPPSIPPRSSALTPTRCSSRSTSPAASPRGPSSGSRRMP